MPARIDITGQRFGKVVVIAEVEPRIYASGEKKSQFLCRCDCGNVFKATSNILRRGDLKSCGCLVSKVKIGQRFGSLVVIDKSKLENGNTTWKCVCDCGTILELTGNRLLSRKKLHCGCQDSLVGKRYGKLIVIEPYGKKERSGGKFVNLWKCKCDCGNYTVTDTNSLNKGHTKSCGCLATKHLMNKSRLHQIWCGMRKRCSNPNCIAYNNYGGRGISVCNEWSDNENGFVNFMKWSYNNGYLETLTLDRIDVNGNYSPNKCRWISKKEQARNTRKNRMITYKGETKCLAEWAEILDINYGTLLSRLDRSKWSVEKAFETPLLKHYRE